MRTTKNLRAVASVMKKFVLNACFYEYIFWILVEAVLLGSINKHTQYKVSSVSLLMHIHSITAVVSGGIRVSVVLCL